MNIHSGFPHLSAMSHGLIHQNQGHHGLDDGCGSYSDARIVPSLGHHFHFPPILIDRAARNAQTGGWLERSANDYILATTDTAQYATRMIALESFRSNFIAVIGTVLRDAGEACSDFDTLRGIYTHHRSSQFCIQFSVNRLAPANRHCNLSRSAIWAGWRMGRRGIYRSRCRRG